MISYVKKYRYYKKRGETEILLETSIKLSIVEELKDLIEWVRKTLFGI